MIAPQAPAGRRSRCPPPRPAQVHHAAGTPAGALRALRRARDRGRPSASRGHREAGAGLRVYPVLPALRPAGRSPRTLQNGPGPLSVRSGPPSRRRCVGTPADSGRRRVLLPQRRSGPAGRALPEPGRSHRERTRPGDLADRARHHPPRRTARTRRRGAADAPHGGRAECYLVPIDICYELVGRMRLLWQGFDGGAEARADLQAFFAHVEGRAARTQQKGQPR